jgi:hypothetical protein
VKKDHWHDILDSEIILGCGIKDGELTVSFHKKGRPSGIYTYHTKDLDLCCQMADSPSKGQFFYAEIRHLPTTRIG